MKTLMEFYERGDAFTQVFLMMLVIIPIACAIGGSIAYVIYALGRVVIYQWGGG